MSKRGFIAFLQELLTMTNPDDTRTVHLAHMVLWNIIEMVEKTKTADPFTRRLMFMADYSLDVLIQQREEFIGVPGQTAENEKKRARLLQFIYPSC